MNAHDQTESIFVPAKVLINSITMRQSCLFLAFLWILSTGSSAYARTLAFPGAEGFGRFAEGGRGGKVIYVEVGGYPTIPLEHWPDDYDKDRDGMRDSWELSHGLNPEDPDDGKIINPDGYSNLEHFLHELAGTPMGKTHGTDEFKIH